MLNGKKILVFPPTVWLNPLWNYYIQLSGESDPLNCLSKLFENLHKSRILCILKAEFN